MEALSDSDINKDWTCKDKNKDQTYQDKDKDLTHKDKDLNLVLKGIGTPVEKNIQSVDLFFPVRLIVSLIVY